MPISVACSKCGFSRDVPDEFAGKQGKCPKCAAVVVVPGRQPSPTSSQQAPAKPKLPTPSTSQQAAMPVAKRVAPPNPVPVKREPVASPSPPATEPDPEPVSAGADEGDEFPWAGEALSLSSSSSRSRSGQTKKRSGSRRTKADDSPDEEESPRASRRGIKKSSLPIPAWAIVAIVGGVVLITGVNVYLFLGASKPIEVVKSKPKADKKSKPVEDDLPSGKLKPPEGLVGPGAKEQGPTTKPGPEAALEDVFAYVKPGIVVIEVFNGGQQLGMGSGFIIDKAGLLLTNYHVVSPGDAAYVQFTDGTRCEVAGYAAVKPEWDLAVLQLKELPPNLRVLNLVHSKKPREASKVMAVGSPLGHAFVPTNGIVGRVVQATDLPASAHAFVLEETGNDEQFWIEHNAQIAPGNSGGPLFDNQGEVIGINSWVDRNVHFGYAIWAWYAHDLLAHRLPQVAPLAKYRKVELSPREALAGLGDLSVTGLQKLFDEVAALNWQPKTAADYLRLQEFARVLTVARLGKEIGLPRDVVSKAIDLSAKLAATKWSADGQITAVNKFAAPEISRPSTGCFLFATVKSKRPSSDGTLLVMQLVGSSQLVGVPATGVEAAIKEGATCLVMGHVSTHRAIFASPSEGRQEATVISAPIVMPIAQ